MVWSRIWWELYSCACTVSKPKKCSLKADCVGFGLENITILLLMILSSVLYYSYILLEGLLEIKINNKHSKSDLISRLEATLKRSRKPNSNLPYLLANHDKLLSEFCNLAIYMSFYECIIWLSKITSHSDNDFPNYLYKAHNC